MTTVFTTSPARRFHATADCRKFHSAQELNDWDCGCDYGCGHRFPRLWAIKERPLSEAIAAGKLPCWSCYRGKLELPPSREDFGHRPVTGFVDGRALNTVCARCTVWSRWRDAGLYAGSHVRWPCTSAVVLGLVR